ncbi:glutathione S-transferase family protein [Rhizobium cremeum]|uniref:glutathione S-transferase family protein n=1 Tax=Rhizobium cremeum TaxID=2813827 RepID=UPI001FD19742|nr:glutathione S-transferase family protein [Rhizobium cremeum]MCJ7996381.1 glutathione S-transferase family protein [Rhizobium cremeum]MCJ8001640.1 glutathione S-transferase family protein [Rhizobium cremeum]
MLTVWGRRTSINLQAVMWTIAELGLEYRRIDAGFTYGVNDTPEFLAMNPNGLVPVLKDGDDEPLFESAAIVRYLASRYGTGPFWPEDLSARAQVDKWAEWSKVTVGTLFLDRIFVPLIRTPSAKRNPQAIAEAVALLMKRLAIAEAQFSKHDFLAGNELTVADIMFGQLLYRYYDLDIERADLPKLKAYYARLCERHAYREHVMVNFDEVRVKE